MLAGRQLAPKELLPTVDAVRPEPPPFLRVSLLRHGSVVQLTVAGELDLASAPELRRRLAALTDARGPLQVQVDASGLSFVDVAGLDVLLDAAAALRRAGGSLRITRASRVMARLVELLGLESLRGDGSEISGPA